MIELFLYRRAACVVPVTNGFAEDMIHRNIPADKIEVITNGVDLDVYKPGQRESNLRSQKGLSEDQFIILYIGAHGISHGLLKVLDAAESLQEEKDVHFLFVGEGAVKSKLIELTEKKQLQNVTFLSGQPREKVSDFYHLADVCLVPLRDLPGLSTFIPSKMFEIMGCGKPIIAPLRGESADILTKSGASLVIPPENSEELVNAVKVLKNDPEKCRRMGKSGCTFVKNRYDRKILARKYLALFERVITSN